MVSVLASIVMVLAGTVTKTVEVEGGAVLHSVVELATLVDDAVLDKDDELEDVAAVDDVEAVVDSELLEFAEELEAEEAGEVVAAVVEPELVDVPEVPELADVELVVLVPLVAMQEHALEILDAEDEHAFTYVGRGAVHVATSV